VRTLLTAKRNERYNKNEKRKREAERERERERDVIFEIRETDEKDTECKDKDLLSGERKRAY
jgi:hypothetical protein